MQTALDEVSCFIAEQLAARVWTRRAWCTIEPVRIEPVGIEPLGSVLSERTLKGQRMVKVSVIFFINQRIL